MELRQEVYVDDPILCAKGTHESVVDCLTVALLWTDVCGFPVSWSKAHGGKKATWIGATIEVVENVAEPHVAISIPERKVEQLEEQTATFLASVVASRRSLRSYAGSLSFVAGLVRFVRPFLNSIWAAISCEHQGGRMATNEVKGSGNRRHLLA